MGKFNVSRVWEQYEQDLSMTKGINFNRIGKILVLITLIAVLFAPIIAIIGYRNFANDLIIMLLSANFVGIILFVYKKKKAGCYETFFWIYVFALFYILVTFSRTTILDRLGLQPYFIVEIITLLTGVIAFGMRLFWKDRIRQLKKFVIENKWLLSFLVLWIIISLEVTGSWTNWDSGSYYKYLVYFRENISLSPSDIQMMKPCGHLSYAWMIVYSLAEMIAPTYAAGVKFLNILIQAITCLEVYYILKAIFKDLSKTWLTILTILYSVTPGVLGPLYEIDSEILIIALVLALILAVIYNDNNILILSGLALLFTKEVGAIYVLGIGIGYLVYSLYMINEIGITEYDKKDCFIKKIFISILIVEAYLTYYFIVASNWGSSYENRDGVYINVFDFNPVTIIARLKQLYLANFEWIFTLIIMIGFIYIYSKEIGIFSINKGMVIIVFSYLAFLMFSLGYVTYVFPRYIRYQYFIRTVLIAWCISKVDANIILRRIVICACIILLLVQSFITIDPITLGIFEKIKIGCTYLSSANVLYSKDSHVAIMDETVKILALSPYAEYNRQFMYKDKLMEKAVDGIRYTSNDIIILPDMFPPYTSGPFFGYADCNYFSREDGRVYQIYDSVLPSDKSLEHINYQVFNKDLEYDLFNYDHIYYFAFEFDEDYNVVDDLSAFEVLETMAFSYRGWKVNVYEVR